MSDNCKVETEVIAIEDDDDQEDVEVVFSNLDKTRVYRNLIQKKISQEIELLKAMCKQTVPSDFDKFKKLAKNLGSQYCDDVIQSAWQRVMKKYILKSNSLQHKSPICMVKPLQTPDPPSRPFLQVHPFPSSSLSRVTTITPPQKVPPSTTCVPPKAIPVALFMNQSIQINNAHQPATECTQFPKLSCAQETCPDDQNGQIPMCSTNNQGFPVSESSHSRMNTDIYASKENMLSDEESSKKVKCGILNANLDKYILSKSGSEQSYKIQTSFEDDFKRYLNSVNSEQTQLIANPEVKKRSSLKRKSSTKEEKVLGLPKDEQVVSKSHVGVRAKIVRTKQTNPAKSRKKPKIKEISEAELKEFKAEQKRLKYEQKREFELQLLHKVTDRLVDVLIPKYHNIHPNGLG